MPTTNQAFNDIQSTIQKISSGFAGLSEADKKTFQNSRSADSLNSSLSSLKGTLTSEQARRTVSNTQKEANKTNTSTGTGMEDAFSKLFGENAKTKQELAKVQAKLTNAESGLSIADQQRKATEDAAAEALLKGKKSNEGEVDPNAPASDDIGLEELAGEDPVLKAMLDSANEQRNSITTSLEVLNKQMLNADEDTQFMVRQIENVAQQQIRRQEKANEAMVRGSKVAGLAAGLAQYSPETHSGIVQETINDGLALIQDIEFKAMEQKYQAKKDLRDFNYKGYLDSQKLITEYNDLKNQTIIKMYEQLQAEEANAREQIKFDNSQADRLSQILAEELIGASESEIRAAAEANGIEYGSLLGNVRAATPAPTAGSKRSTQVITIDGKQVLVDTQTGEVISEFGEGSVDFNTYLEVAQDELRQTIDPDSSLYKELQSDWENTYNKKETTSGDTVVGLYSDTIKAEIDSGKSPEAAVRKITESDKTKLTREEEQALLDYAKGL